MDVEKLRVQDKGDKQDEEIIFSDTDMSDEGTDLLYKRYKLSKHDNQATMKDLTERAEEMMAEFRTQGKVTMDEKKRALTDKNEIMNEIHKLFQKKSAREKLDYELESMMSKIRLNHELNKFKITDVYNIYDPNYYGELPLDDEEEAANLPLPEELRRYYMTQRYEETEEKYPIYDEKQGREYEDHAE